MKVSPAIRLAVPLLNNTKARAAKFRYLSRCCADKTVQTGRVSVIALRLCVLPVRRGEILHPTAPMLKFPREEAHGTSSQDALRGHRATWRQIHLPPLRNDCRACRRR